MRTRKLRGHRRRWKAIDRWTKTMRQLNTDELRRSGQRDHAKIAVHPWNSISLIDSRFREPYGKTKRLMLDGLLEIYDGWQEKLNELGEPYYLKIWLFEPHFTRSRVVCAIRDNLHFYDNTFFQPETSGTFRPETYGPMADRLRTFNWTMAHEEVHLDNTEPGRPEDFASEADFLKYRKWVTKLLRRPHRTTKFASPIGDVTESYSIRTGTVWIGGR